MGEAEELADEAEEEEYVCGESDGGDIVGEADILVDDKGNSCDEATEEAEEQGEQGGEEVRGGQAEGEGDQH